MLKYRLAFLPSIGYLTIYQMRVSFFLILSNSFHVLLGLCGQQYTALAASNMINPHESLSPGTHPNAVQTHPLHPRNGFSLKLVQLAKVIQ